MTSTETPHRFDFNAPPPTKEEKAEKLRQLHESQPGKGSLAGLFGLWSDEFTDEEFDAAMNDLMEMRRKGREAGP